MECQWAARDLPSVAKQICVIEHQVMHLDLAKYSEVRDAVLERLGDSAQLLISDIAL